MLKLSITLDLPFGLSDIEKVFKISELLDNKEELVQDFLPEVSKYLVKNDFFHGPYRHQYNKMFNELIIQLIRKQIIKHFPNFSPEDVVILTDEEFLRMITTDYYFNPEVYKNAQKTASMDA